MLIAIDINIADVSDFCFLKQIFRVSSYKFSMKRIRKSKRQSSASGFTLMELAVVMSIVGLLMSISLPSFLSIVDRVKCQAYSWPVRQHIIDEFKLENGASDDSLGVNVRATIDCFAHQGVTREVPVEGSFKGNIPVGKKLHVVIFVPSLAEEGNPIYYWPITFEGNGRWKSDIYLGGVDDPSGQEYFVGVTLIDTNDPLLGSGNEDNGYGVWIGKEVGNRLIARRQ